MMTESEFNKLPKAQREAIQQRLKDQGLYAGGIDASWGSGTAAALQEEDRRRVDQENQARQGRIQETTANAQAVKTKAEADRITAEAEAAKTAAALKGKYNTQAGAPEGIAATTGSWVGAPLAGLAVGRGMGKGTNALMDLAQTNRNKVLQGAAADRVAGLTTRDAAQAAIRQAGAAPFENPALRTASRMAPHLGLGAFALGKGAYTLANNDDSQGFWPQVANRAAGLGWIGAGTGLMEQGVRYAASPGVSPDAKALAIIGSNQLRRGNLPGGNPDIPQSPDGTPSGTRPQLYAQAKQLGLPVTTRMKKAELSDRLVEALKTGGKNVTKGIFPAAVGYEVYDALTHPSEAADGTPSEPMNKGEAAAIGAGSGAAAGYGWSRLKQALSGALPNSVRGALGTAGEVAGKALGPELGLASPEAMYAGNAMLNTVGIGNPQLNANASGISQLPERGDRGLLGRRDINAANLQIPANAYQTMPEQGQLSPEAEHLLSVAQQDPELADMIKTAIQSRLAAAQQPR